MTTFGFRLVAACSLLVGLVFLQDPGLLVPDTKLDLVGDPVGFLKRALHLWDAEGAFGQLQNQAYGYLWPMGPFFALGWLVDLPGWIVQRLWQALVVCVAFTGAAKVSRALGVRSDFAALLAGLAYALSPRMLTTLGPISIEAWPSAVAPWVLLPLVLGARRGSPRRAAAWSALAVAMVGGVNAAATFAVLPLGIVWLLTREPGPRRRALMLWWPLCTALGTLWWLVPLFLMGAYSPAFLDYIETSSITTLPTTLFDALRGTSNWVPYVDGDSRAGNDLVTTPHLALASGLVLLLGLAGLLARRTPHRPFLAISVLVGMVMVTAGHQGAVPGWFAADLAVALDGALSPLRNVHKFDPIIRLPLVLGLAFVVDRAVARAAERRPPRPRLADRVNRYAFVGMAVVVVVGAALPALQTRVEPAGGTLGVPDHWVQAAEWLAEQDSEGVALIVPGAPFGEYVWGALQDEPLQYLAESRWAVRNVIPLTPEGNIRLLGEIEQHLARGTGSAGLTALLRRSGVRHLVVRNDLRRSGDTPDPLLVHQALDRSPGIDRVVSFGPPVGGDAHLDGPRGRVLVNHGWQAEYPAVEIYAVSGSGTGAVTSSAAPIVVGGPEDLGDLVDLGLLGGTPTVLAADAGEEGADLPGERLVLTDGLRARERAFSRIHDAVSPVLPPGAPRRTGSPARDYLLDEDDRWSTTVRWEGAEAVRASSSASDAGTFEGSRRGQSPYAALDGRRATAWVSGDRAGRAWWQVDLERPRWVTTVTLVGGAQAEPDQLVRVSTDVGRPVEVALGPGERRRVRLDAERPASWIRVADGSPPGNRTIEVAEVDAPGLDVERTLVLPEVPEEWGTPDAIALRADRDARDGCVEVATDVRCVPGRASADEEATGLRRALTVAAPADYHLDVTVRPTAGPVLDDLVLAGQPVDVAASSVAVPDTRASAVAAVDGDPGTTWIADLDDRHPTYTISWLGRRTVRALSFSIDDDAAARLPATVRVSWPGGDRVVDLRDGWGSLPPLRTDRLRIQVLEAEDTRSLGFDEQADELGVGFSELRVSGVEYLPLGLSADRVGLPCGTGPQVSIAGRSTATAVRASPAELLAGAALRARTCERRETRRGESMLRPGPQRVRLPAGESIVDVDDSSAFAVESVVLQQPADRADQGPAVRQRTVGDEGPVVRTVETDPGDAVVALRENTNPGWSATRDGRRLEPVVVDGWQQGWLLPEQSADAAGGTVRAVFAPDRLYRVGLLVGALAVLGLLGVVWLTGRGWAGPVLASAGPRAVPRPLLAVLALLGGGLLAGWPGLAVGVVAWAAVDHGERRAPADLPWLLAGPLLLAAGWYALRPWGDPAGWAGSQAWPQLLVLLPVLSLLLRAREPRERPDGPRDRRPDHGGGRLRQRIVGTSTRR